MRKAAWVLALGLLLLAGVVGLKNGPGELEDAATGLQRTVAFGETLYGVLGILGAVGLWRRRPWSAAIAAAWSITVMYVASVASFAYHDPTFSQKGTATGVISSAIATGLVGAFVVWTARRATRAATPAPSEGTAV